MSLPSMVHLSGGSLIVRSVVSGNALYGSADVAEDDYPADESIDNSVEQNKDLPDCKVKRNYSCSKCDFFTQNPRNFLYHLRDDHQEKVKIYECPNCLYASKHYQKLLRHKKMVHGTSDADVNSETSRKSTRKRPAPTDDEEGSLDAPEDDIAEGSEETERPSVFKCSLCSTTRKTQAQLAKHEREKHILTKFFRCSKCTYVTHIKARYTKHVKYHSMPMIKCDMCDFRTPYKWNLDRHCKNHNGRGAFRCSACNFTADIKQSLTVHEMNHHIPPVGQAAGLGVGRRRNKVGASDATAAEEAAYQAQAGRNETEASTTQSVEDDGKKPKVKPVKKLKSSINHNEQNSARTFGSSDFIHPDDLIQHSNGKVYIKNKCKLCNYKTAWDGEMAKHEKNVHNINREENTSKPVKKSPRPIPNLIPIATQTSVLKVNQRSPNNQPPPPPLKVAEIPQITQEPIMSQKDYNDICAKSSNSVLKDFASLFSSEDVFKSTGAPKVPDLIPASAYNSSPKTKNDFGHKNASFFDRLKQQLEEGLGASGSCNNLICKICGYESKCLTEQAKHQKVCGKPSKKLQIAPPIHNTSSSRCSYCRQRCKSSADVFNHFKVCPILINQKNKEESDTTSEHELTIDEEHMDEQDTKPHPMENKVFVWNDIHVPMDIEVDDSNYEYTEDKVDDTVSLDLSIRTQSPGGSESSYVGPEFNNISQHPSPVADKIPTHGNDITVAQHKRVFKCPHCTFWASTASRFHVHIVGHLNKKPFECSLCSYRSNWRWDITKHIKLKSVRDQAHENAKVLMTDETGRRNYTKYNKYLTEIPVTGDQSMDTSGGSGTRPKHHERNSSPSTSKNSDLPKLTRAPNSLDFSPLLRTSPLRPPPPLKSAEGQMFAKINDKKAESKRTHFKCKKCNFRDPSREVLLQHVKGHYQPGLGASSSSQDLSLRGTSPDKDERHCRLKHNGVISVVSNKNGQEKIEVEEQTDEPDHVDVVQEGKFKCSQCPFSNDNELEFEHHLTGHVPNNDNIFKCCYCKYFVSRKEDILDHFKLHGIPNPEDFLNKITDKGSGEGNSKKFGCMLCPYITNSKSQYTYHKQFHKPRGGQYTCTMCNYNVSKKHLLHQHLKVHDNNKQNGDVIDLDEMSDEIEEVSPLGQPIETQNFSDIPLVWVSKSGKFSKMFKCRYCPHVNLRKVNIQDHEKMHSIRERNPNSTRINDVEHHCSECNYVCNNAGVLSSHSKVHQGLYGVIHRLVDPVRSDEDQIREISQYISSPDVTTELVDEYEAADNSMDSDEHLDAPESILFFCSKCPARFLKENEFLIHKNFHGLRLFYKCDFCSFTARQKPYILSHSKIHSNEYHNRTHVLLRTYMTNPKFPQPEICSINTGSGEIIWVVQETHSNDIEMETYVSPKPARAFQNVPLSGTDLFIQKSEAQQKHAADQAAQLNKEQSPPPLQKPADPQFGTLMHGNPDFIYPTYLKNGRMKEKRYKCHKCPSAFEKREQYKIHLGLHGSKQRYKCIHCDYSVKYYANYVQHLKKHKLNADAQAAKGSKVDVLDEAVDMEAEDNEVTNETNPQEICEDANGPLKLGVADMQMLSILQQRKSSPPKELPAEEKKLFWCTNCPYTSHRKDAVENHQKRHGSISGTKSSYKCEHCDYSVPQSHFLREHTKLHFVQNKVNQIEGFMHCDNMKLTLNKVNESSVLGEKKSSENVIFEEHGSKVDEKQFLPPLSAEITERFNNNKGERQFINIQTGEIVDRNDTSDTQSLETKDCNTEVN